MRMVPVQSEADIATVADLADTIWREHFPGIISVEQVDYMVAKYQSLEAIRDQLGTGELNYFLAEIDGRRVGYCAYRIEDEAMFLSKLYLLKSERGKGLARKLVAWLTDTARAAGAGSVWLTCNRFNTGALLVYARLGFAVETTVCKPIGGGFVMDDYIMRKQL